MQRLIEYVSFNSAFSFLSYTAGPAGRHTPPAAKVIPCLMYLTPSYSKPHPHCSQDAVPWCIHSTQPTWCWCPLISSEVHLEAIQESPNHIAPVQKGIHSGTSTMRWRQQDSIPGDQFYCLPGTSQEACCSLFQSRQVAALFIVFSAVTGKLDWGCHKYRRGTLKSCFISSPGLVFLEQVTRTEHWRDAASSHEAASTFQVGPPQWHSFISWRKKNNLSENSTWTVRTPVRDSLFWEEIHLSYQILSGTLRLEIKGQGM